jgi:LytS/YehU family sensor histidine kinase
MFPQLNKPFNLTLLLVKNRWIWHLGFWLLYIISRARAYYITILFYHKAYIEFMLIVDFTIVFVIYITSWLFSRYFIKGKYVLYYLLGLALWLLYLVFVITIQKKHLQVIPDIAKISWSYLYMNNLSYYLLQFLLVTMAKYFKTNYIYQYYENEKKQQQMRHELDNLKAQVSPHFLFNTLNNFYGLAVEQSKKLPDLMIRLSDLLRYSLYETSNNSVSIFDEMAYLNNYIELEKIRLEDTLQIEFKTDIKPNQSITIAPLILMVFVENAFKHAKNTTNNIIEVKINISITNDKQLTFLVKNNYQEQSNSAKSGGIGLNIVKKRLQLLYPNEKHALLINTDAHYFNVELKINLK